MVISLTLILSTHKKLKISIFIFWNNEVPRNTWEPSQSTRKFFIWMKTSRIWNIWWECCAAVAVVLFSACVLILFFWEWSEQWWSSGSADFFPFFLSLKFLNVRTLQVSKFLHPKFISLFYTLMIFKMLWLDFMHAFLPGFEI